MLEDVFEKFLRIYKAKLLELDVLRGGVLFGKISLCFDEWNIILEKYDNSCTIAAIPDLPCFLPSVWPVDQWKLISELDGKFDYSGPVLGEQMKKYILEALSEYPKEKKVTAAIEAIKSTLMSPVTSGIYARFKFKN